MNRTEIKICLAAGKSEDFIQHLAIIRRIDGLKVLKRRKKPFYDITGVVDTEQAFLELGHVLSYLMAHCEAELVIDDADLRQKVLKVV